MEHIAVYFTGEIDPDSHDTQMERVERPTQDESAPLIIAVVHDPTNADPVLAAFHELPDQGDG